MERKGVRFGWKNWLTVLLVGLAGQLAWVIENNQINLWVYSQTQNSNYITIMTTVSAVAATLTTFFMGVLSDRLGKRKIFIAGGYVLWGISVGAFGLASFSNMEVMFGAASAALAVGIAMALLDTVMTFFGSTSNDACFNAFVTDITVKENRGKIESFLSVLPLLANVVMLFAQMLCGADAEIDPDLSIAENAAQTASGWQLFFLIFGILVTIVGIASFFLIDDSKLEPRKEGNYLANLVYGFRPSVVKKNGRLYLALLTFMAFNAAVDSFLPYYMVYFQNPVELGGLGYSGDNIFLFYLAFAIILVLSSAVAIVSGVFMERLGKRNLLFPAMGLGLLGSILLAAVPEPEPWFVILAATLLMSGYLVGTACLGAIIRDYTPKGEAGLFQGVRMIFAVMVPMIVGSNVSQLVFNLTSELYESSTTFEEIYAPNANMFYVAAAFMALAAVPGTFFYLTERKGKGDAPAEGEI